jgi:ribosomal protein S27AE
MDVTIKQSCPSCGASIVLSEDDRLIQCPYCDVHNYKTGSIVSRYVLPAKLPDHLEDKHLLFAPYLRFKGSIFYVQDKEVKYKIVDTTRLGLDNQQLPISLGLRPQAMKITPVASSTRGAFLLQSIPTKAVFAHAAMVLDLFKEKNPKTIYHRTFIGETLSRIYQPCYIKDDQLYDAVSNRIIGQRTTLAKDLGKTCSSKVSWEPQFITTACPGCGGLLAGERDSMVLQCGNCQSLWQEHKQKFIPVDWKVVHSDNRNARYLPFWQITFSTTGHTLKSFGDFLRFTNQPLVAMQKYETQPLVFWIPAFKINPKAFLQMSSQLTVAQARIPQGEKRPVTRGYPVTLDSKEAKQAIKTVLAKTTVSHEKRFSLLPKIRLGECRSVLTYLPFAVQAHDLIQEHTCTTIQTAALRHGRAL